jgi:hypothetical protein
MQFFRVFDMPRQFHDGQPGWFGVRTDRRARLAAGYRSALTMTMERSWLR